MCYYTKDMIKSVLQNIYTNEVKSISTFLS